MTIDVAGYGPRGRGDNSELAPLFPTVLTELDAEKIAVGLDAPITVNGINTSGGFVF